MTNFIHCTASECRFNIKGDYCNIEQTESWIDIDKTGQCLDFIKKDKLNENL